MSCYCSLDLLVLSRLQPCTKLDAYFFEEE
jgi:hypothetical protein